MNFTNFKKKIIQEATHGGPKHLIIEPGLILFAVCKIVNKCKASGQKVCVNRGFGKDVRINEIYGELECPLCKGPTELARTVILYKTEYRILAKNMEANPPEIKDITDKTEGNKYHFFAEDDQNICRWSSILITTRPLS